MTLSSLVPAAFICSARPFEGDAGTLGESGFAGFLLAVFGDVAGFLAVGDDDELIAGLGEAFEAEDFDGSGGRSFGEGLAAIVEHGADFAVGVADDEIVAGVEGAVLHEDGGDGAAAAIELGFEDDAAGGAAGSGFELLEIGGEADHFEEEIEIGFLFGGDVDEDGFAAPLFGDEAAIGELLFDAIGQGVGLIDFVDGDDDGDFGGVSVVDGLDGLRHDAIVGSGDENDDVSGFGAAGTHAGEGLVAGGIEEDDLASEGGRGLVGDANFVGADVLGDAAGFAAGNVGGANGIEERGFAVIDVAHDGDDGRTGNGFDAFLAGLGGFGGVFRGLLFEGDDFGVGSEEARHFAGEFGVESLIDGGEDAAHDEAGDDIFGANAEFFGEIFNRDALGDGDVFGDGHRLVADDHPRRRSVALHRAFFYTARNVTLAGATRRRAGTATGTSGTGRRADGRAGTDAERARASGGNAGGMHGTTFAGTQRRTGSGSLRALWALKNGLPGNGASGGGANGCAGRWNGSFVDGPGTRLGHDHAGQRSSGLGGRGGSVSSLKIDGLRGRLGRRHGSDGGRSGRGARRNGDGGRSSGGGRSGRRRGRDSGRRSWRRSFGRNDNDRGRTHSGNRGGGDEARRGRGRRGGGLRGHNSCRRQRSYLFFL